MIPAILGTPRGDGLVVGGGTAFAAGTATWTVSSTSAGSNSRVQISHDGTSANVSDDSKENNNNQLHFFFLLLLLSR